MAEQGQGTCHIALGQVYAHQAEQGVRLREEKKQKQDKTGEIRWWMTCVIMNIVPVICGGSAFFFFFF